MPMTRSHYVRMNYPKQIELLRAIDAGTAFDRDTEDWLEEQGLVKQTDKPYAVITPAGRKLLAEAAPQV